MYAEIAVPIATIQIVARWTAGPQPPPAEDPQAEERRLEEEREQALDRQRRTEDVAHEPAVAAPVHAELELLDDPGHHAQGEVDQEQLPEEAGQAQVRRIARPVPRGLEAGHREREADGQRHEQEVVDGGDPELPARQNQWIHELTTSLGNRVPAEHARAPLPFEQPNGPCNVDRWAATGAGATARSGLEGRTAPARAAGSRGSRPPPAQAGRARSSISHAWSSACHAIRRAA